MQIGFVGLGRMGAGMVGRLLDRGGHQVVAYDRSPSAVEVAVAEGAGGVGSLEELVRALRPPRTVWIMVPAGDPVDETLGTLADLGTPGDCFVEGGNSHYKDTLRRARELNGRGYEMLDVGTSGGIWGRTAGYCMMVGGTVQGFARIEPVLRDLAPEGGYARIGPSGAGHFAKMVHNGIEYGLMQAYAEGFALLEGSSFDYDLERVARLWGCGSVVRSWLLEMAAAAFATDPRLEGIAGYVEDTGEGRWTVEAAIEEAVPAPVITQALFARFRSRQQDAFADRVVATLRRQFGGHTVREA